MHRSTMFKVLLIPALLLVVFAAATAQDLEDTKKTISVDVHPHLADMRESIPNLRITLLDSAMMPVHRGEGLPQSSRITLDLGDTLVYGYSFPDWPYENMEEIYSGWLPGVLGSSTIYVAVEDVDGEANGGFFGRDTIAVAVEQHLVWENYTCNWDPYPTLPIEIVLEPMELDSSVSCLCGRRENRACPNHNKSRGTFAITPVQMPMGLIGGRVEADPLANDEPQTGEDLPAYGLAELSSEEFPDEEEVAFVREIVSSDTVTADVGRCGLIEVEESMPSVVGGKAAAQDSVRKIRGTFSIDAKVVCACGFVARPGCRHGAIEDKEIDDAGESVEDKGDIALVVATLVRKDIIAANRTCGCGLIAFKWCRHGAEGAEDAIEESDKAQPALYAEPARNLRNPSLRGEMPKVE